MSWTTALLDLYNKNASRAGKVENWNGKLLTLIPIGFDTTEAQIQVMIDVNGKFDSARELNKPEAETLVPYPEGRTSGKKALPLFDNLKYIAGDYAEHVQDKLGESKKCHELYIDGLAKWCESKYCHPAIQAVYNYVLKNKMIADLIQAGVLVADNDGKLNKNKKIQSINQSDAFVRFCVYPELKTGVKNECDEAINFDSNIWLYRPLQERFTQYYLSSIDVKGLCYITGEHVPLARMSSTKIRDKGDQTRLISSNDKVNFTYKGRFNTNSDTPGYNEAMSIGYESSQKIINALKWIIRRQGYHLNGICIVTWESNLKQMPNYYDGTLGITGIQPTNDENIELSNDDLFDEAKLEYSDTNYFTAAEFNKAIDGYYAAVDDASLMNVLSLDSVSRKGRLALTYFKELSSSRYLNNIRSWQKSCCWRQEYFNKEKKLCRYAGIASIKEIANSVYGSEQNKRLTLRLNNDGKAPMLIAAFDRLRPCIIDRKPIPLDIVKMAVSKASNPVAYEISFNYLRVLHTACSLVKKYYWEKGVKFDMKLDKNCSDRSYLFGRLLAVAEKIERSSYESGEKRTTNAERYMSQFSRTPMRTWKTIRTNTQVYLNHLNSERREEYKDLYGSICSLFEEGAFESKSALDGRYLLGYDCQREELKYPTAKDDNTSTGSDTEKNDNNNEEEN